VELNDRRIPPNVLTLTCPYAALTAAMPLRPSGRIVATVPIGRMAEPEEIAKVALFLGSGLTPASSRVSEVCRIAQIASPDYC